MIYITGATGHVGNNLVRKLTQEKYDFRILARKITKAIEDFKKQTIIGDIFDENFLNETLQDNDVLVHLAAYINLKNDQRDLTYKINYEGTKTIADICVRKNVYLIFSSSVDAIRSDDYLVTETNHLKIDCIDTLYQKTKALASNYILDLSNKTNLRSLVLYPSAIIGINDYKPSPIGKEIKKCFKRRVCLYFQGGYNFIDVEDVTNAIISSIQTQYLGQVIISGQYVSLYDMYRLIFKALDRKVIMIKIPIYLIKLVSNIIPRFKVMIKALLSNHNYDNTKMINDLKIQPLPISLTIDKTVKWFIEEKTK